MQAGRVEFLQQFRSLTDPAMKPVFADPEAERTFQRCKLDFADRERNAPLYQLTKDLLTLRRGDPAFRAQRPRGVDGAVLGESAFVLRYFADDGLDRLLLVNFGRDRHLLTCPEPLLAPPECCGWRVALSTDDPKYGGAGVGPVDTDGEGWRVPGEAAVVLVPEVVEKGPVVMHHGRLGGGAGRIIY